MKTHSAISFLALVAISAAVKPWTLDVRCRIFITGANTNCSSLKYYYNLRKPGCESTCFQGAPFRSQSACHKICGKRKQPQAQSSVPDSSVYEGHSNSSKKQQSKSPTLQAPLVTQSSWSAGKIAAPPKKTWPRLPNTVELPENNHYGAQNTWPQNHKNVAMAPSRAGGATADVWDIEPHSRSSHDVPSQQHNSEINPVIQHDWLFSNPSIALASSFPLEMPQRVPQRWTGEWGPPSNEHVPNHVRTGSNRQSDPHLVLMPWTSRNLDNNIMPAMPYHSNGEIGSHEKNWQRNSQPNEEMGRVHLPHVHQQDWTLSDTNTGMMPTYAELNIPVQLRKDAKEPFPEDIPLHHFAIRSHIGAQVLSQVLQPEKPRVLTAAGYGRPEIQFGLEENWNDGTPSEAAGQESFLA